MASTRKARDAVLRVRVHLQATSWRVLGVKVVSIKNTPYLEVTPILCTGSSACGTPPHQTDFFKYPAKQSEIGQNNKQNILVQLVEMNR